MSSSQDESITPRTSVVTSRGLGRPSCLHPECLETLKIAFKSGQQQWKLWRWKRLRRLNTPAPSFHKSNRCTAKAKSTASQSAVAQAHLALAFPGSAAEMLIPWLHQAYQIRPSSPGDGISCRSLRITGASNPGWLQPGPDLIANLHFQNQAWVQACSGFSVKSAAFRIKLPLHASFGWKIQENIEGKVPWPVT